VFSSTSIVTLPAPSPLAPSLMDIQLASETEVHWQPVGAATSTVFSPPDHDDVRMRESTDRADGWADIDSDQVHFTFGGGVVVMENFQIDGGINLAENTKEGVLSFVVRF